MSEEINHNRLRFLAVAAMTVAAVPFGVTGCAVQRMARAEAKLPIEGELPSLGGATSWLNSQPLTASSLVNMPQMTVSQISIQNTTPSPQQRQHWLSANVCLIHQ